MKRDKDELNRKVIPGPDDVITIQSCTVIDCNCKICSICGELPVDPVSIPCGHVYCRVCIKTWLEKKPTCPFCREPARPDQLNISLDRIAEIKDQRVYCPCGCDYIGTFRELIDVHLKTCIYRMIKCFYCALPVVRREESVHVEIACQQYPIECEHCKVGIRRCDIEEHISRTCPESPYVLVNCICGGSIVKKDVNEHMATNALAHLMIVTKQLMEIREEIKFAKVDQLVIHPIRFKDPRSQRDPEGPKAFESVEFSIQGIAFHAVLKDMGAPNYYLHLYSDDTTALSANLRTICISFTALGRVAQPEKWYRSDGKTYHNGSWAALGHGWTGCKIGEGGGDYTTITFRIMIHKDKIAPK